ncbi:MAG: hypothetical protein V7K69_14105 [Nostoc sp.]
MLGSPAFIYGDVYDGLRLRLTFKTVATKLAIALNIELINIVMSTNI